MCCLMDKHERQQLLFLLLTAAVEACPGTLCRDHSAQKQGKELKQGVWKRVIVKYLVTYK
jgi:hypothetical protein